MWLKSGTRYIHLGFSGALACSLMLGACQSPTTGGLRFHFAAPLRDAGPLGFQIQAIPPDTELFEIQVQGTGLASPLRAEIPWGQSETAVTHTLDAIPAGPKQVRVRALAGSRTLAQASASVVIAGGQTSRVELELQPVNASAATLRLSEALPLPVRADLRIQGEGLTNPLTAQLSFAAGQQTAALPELPPGPKQIQIIYSTQIQEQILRSEAQNESFEVAADGTALLEIPADRLMLAFSQSLDRLLENLSQAQLLALLAQFGEVRLRVIFAALPPAVQARILANPRLQAFAERLPGALPSATPTPEPTAEPTPETPEPTPDALLGDVRLLLTSTTQPLQQLQEPAEENEATALRMRLLTPGEDHLVFRNTFWALLLRTRYQGDQFISYGANLTREGDAEVLWRDNGEIRTAVPFGGEDYLGTVIFFNRDQTLLTLEPGRYVLTLNMRNPFNQNLEDYRFRIQVPPRFE